MAEAGSPLLCLGGLILPLFERKIGRMGLGRLKPHPFMSIPDFTGILGLNHFGGK